MNRIIALLMGGILWGGIVFADEVPISGIIKAIDPVANTVTVETTAKGKTREVTIDIKPTSRIVRFTRSAGAGNPGFTEQVATLGDLKPGWTISVTTTHAGGREVADVMKVVLER